MKPSFRTALIIASALLVTEFATMKSSKALAEPTLVVIVRHADRGNEPAADPALTPEGARRASALASALASANIASIITTQYRRTRDTAGPLAKALGIEPLVVPARRDDLSAHVREVADAVRRRSGNVLIVGHSDTVSAILAALNGPTLPKLCESSFDHIYVLAYGSPKSSFLSFRYGEPSPAPTEGCQ